MNDLKSPFSAVQPSRRQFMLGTGTMLAGAAFGAPAIAQANEVTIISNIGDAGQRAVLQKIADGFSKQSGTTVTINNMDHEAHKTAIRSYLVVGAPDLCFWFSGNRMKAFVKRGLFDDISDLVQKENYQKALGTNLNAVTVDGKQYGLPLSGLLWGMFYRKDVFAEKNWTPPKTVDDLFALAEKAKSAGMIPVSMGTKEMWPAAGWFDHMNLRINGLEKHMELMDGKMAYTDAALTPVFDKWSEMVKAGLFTPDHTSAGWEQAAAALAQKRAAMMDLAGFVKYGFPADQIDQIGYAPFPEIAPGMARYEDFSLNSIHVPKNAKNKQGARDFLAYFYTPENLGAFVDAESGVPPRNDCPPSKDPLIGAAVDSLKTVAGAAQYYDRDTDPDIAQEGLKGFQEFMVKPDRRDQILQRLETARKRVIKT
ncbi:MULTISPECIES: ABC transporter substrate-binding protein [unclassified Rhizobium]|uniref:ABC transporter substrate-binding protein n=1 Tax=unclassified Rhizobium TaxID=2613769 RepID=UPI001ADBAE21|nr:MULTISPECIES: ABC transporter substrate-binding protein [unclassified Rhizobium]MBO9101220.1 carbohydrate ABC transporter substrate-binding protein [Rhizobium sp. L58/93]MBO9170873.1 carbohydrate ABC transporter substrate-binding protein [Rhizobium sp. L245/93]MBO9186786.1 carbohydrate ABC transporter substrate-binding protein [Rhizobium sp. E27B/91]QXZ86335.1 carbohydrate ABC transporter substrate-binding protein [Rhizobium sp. K1/93]QXZ92210.1 carbohydrate ABC transporter substrate-bindin